MSSTWTDPQTADDSETILAQMMLPEDTNPAGNVHGGTLMKLADTAGGTAAVRHSRGHPCPVHPLDVRTADDRRHWEEAEARRARRLAEAHRKGEG